MSLITHDITCITRYGFQNLDEKLKGTGIRGRHASYLIELCREPGISQDTLAQRICISKSNVTRQLAMLEEDGFVTRRPCAADKRILRCYPTEKARELLPRILTVMRQWEDKITGELSSQEKETITSLLARMKVGAAALMEVK